MDTQRALYASPGPHFLSPLSRMHADSFSVGGAKGSPLGNVELHRHVLDDGASRGNRARLDQSRNRRGETRENRLDTLDQRPKLTTPQAR